MKRRPQAVDSFKGILPRELVSDGVLEYKIPSSTIWNRCSWAGTDFRNIRRTTSFTRFPEVFQFVRIVQNSGTVLRTAHHPLIGAERSPVFWPPLTKADRFPLVFRVSIMSSTIWNRLQCGGTINKQFVPATCWHDQKVPAEGSTRLCRHSCCCSPKL